jgi:hypothetical protein
MKKLFIPFGVLLFWSCESSFEKEETLAPTVGNVELGKEIAGKSFLALSTTLQSVMQTEGPVAAIQYCNVHAIPLIDSLSQAHDVLIKRTSLRVRNPEDAPNQEEIGVLNEFQTIVSNGDIPVAKMVGNSFYAPIFIQDGCLVCHGVPGEKLSYDLHTKILALYPSDAAFGYQAGDLRGMWSIIFKN